MVMCGVESSEDIEEIEEIEEGGVVFESFW